MSIKSLQYIPLSNFYEMRCGGKESHVRTLTPNFTIVIFKMWTSGLKIAKNGIFWYKFSPKWVYPRIRFVQNYACWRASQDYTSTPNLTIVASKMWPYGPKNRPKW